jgi:glycosyltransferase involved in cell wall biosynthesis
VTTVHILASRADRSGGADVYTSELVKRLPSRGYDVTLLCHGADAETANACRVLTVGRGRSHALPLLWRFSPLLQLASVNHSMRQLEISRPDVVIGMAHQLIWAHNRRFGRCPLLYVPHSMIAPVEVASYRWNSPVQRNVATSLWGHLEHDALNRAFRTIRFTQAGCRILESHYGDSVTPRFQVVPHAVDLPRIDRARQRAAAVKLLSVGRLVPTKNHQFLIEVLARLTHINWTLDIIGDGEERNRLETLAQSANLLGRIKFIGHVRDPGEFYSRADVLVAPSRLENAPLVILEAMAYGTPSLTIRSDGARYLNANHELVTDGADGFLARDEEDFARQLATLLSSPERLVTAGEQARLTVERRHTWATHLDAYDELCRGAVASSTH